LKLALANAKHDPDGQVFPWRGAYPLAGGTVYYEGKLWTVVQKSRGDQTRVKLAGQGHDEVVTAARGDLRPVTWTQHDEERLDR
jgi:hypothetical protein